MSTGSKYLFGRLVEYQIKNDTLYRCEYIDDTICKEIPIITKPEFLMCYEAWVKAESEE